MAAQKLGLYTVNYIQSHPIPILPSQQNIEMCLQLSKYWTMFFGVWGLHNPPAIPQLLQPPEEPPEVS